MNTFAALLDLYRMTDPTFSSYDPDDAAASIIAHADVVIADPEANTRAKACAQVVKDGVS